MKVRIAERKLSNKRVRLYLDIHHGDGRRSLKYYPFMEIKQRPANEKERTRKKEVWDLMEQNKNQVERELLQGIYGINTLRSSKTDFLEYFQKYIDALNCKDIRVWNAVLKKTKSFFKKEKVEFTDITPASMQKLVHEFENTLNGVTPVNYTKKLKRVVAKARKEKYILNDPFEDVKLSKHISGVKEILSEAELKILYKKHCPNITVKRAFLISCYTGIRYSDIKALKWHHVKADRIEFIQQKTKVPAKPYLVDEAKNILKKRGNENDFVFNLPSHTACNRAIKEWLKNAEIDKHITWHCSRHSCATILMRTTKDMQAIARILGHTSIRHTELYTHQSDERAKETILKFPKILS